MQEKLACLVSLLRAQMTMISAKVALPIQRLRPLSTQPPSTWTMMEANEPQPFGQIPDPFTPYHRSGSGGTATHGATTAPPNIYTPLDPYRLCADYFVHTFFAVDCRAEASEPLEGSVRPQAPIFFRRAMSGSSSLFCSSDASRPAEVKLVLSAEKR